MENKYKKILMIKDLYYDNFFLKKGNTYEIISEYPDIIYIIDENKYKVGLTKNCEKDIFIYIVE